MCTISVLLQTSVICHLQSVSEEASVRTIVVHNLRCGTKPDLLPHTGGGKKRVVCYFLFSESPWFYKHRMLFFKQSSHYVFRTSSIHCWHFLVCIFCKRSHLLLLTVRPVINHCCSGATRSNCQRCELSSPTFHVVTVHVFPGQKAVDSPLKSCCIMQ